MTSQEPSNYPNNYGEAEEPDETTPVCSIAGPVNVAVKAVLFFTFHRGPHHYAA